MVEVDWFFQDASARDWLHIVTIPIFTGVIGWLINWSGLWMLFSPVRFYGFQVPGLKAIARIMPRKLQEIPGILTGGIGWQGIVPARAAKMGSIASDTQESSSVNASGCALTSHMRTITAVDSTGALTRSPSR